MEKLKYTLLALFLFLISYTSNYGQESPTITSVVENLEKGSYVILEVRMQLEDEFQTVEGNQSANLSRIAIFTGKNKDKEILTKGFTGYNQVVLSLNELEEAGFVLQETYPIKGNSLLITHYVFRKGKK